MHAYVSGGGDDVQAQTGTAYDPVTGSSTPIFAPAQPTFNYIDQAGKVQTSYGTPPHFIDDSGHVATIYGGESTAYVPPSTTMGHVNTGLGWDANAGTTSPDTGQVQGAGSATDTFQTLSRTTVMGVPLLIVVAAIVVIAIVLVVL